MFQNKYYRENILPFRIFFFRTETKSFDSFDSPESISITFFNRLIDNKTNLYIVADLQKPNHLTIYVKLSNLKQQPMQSLKQTLHACDFTILSPPESYTLSSN